MSLVRAGSFAEVGLSAGWFLDNAFLIPVIPAVAFALIILFGKKMPMKGSEIGLASMVASCVLAAGVAYQWIQRVDAAAGAEGQTASALGSIGRAFRLAKPEGEGAAAYVEPVIRKVVWWQSNGLEIGLGQHIDGLAVMLLLLVAFISTLVQIYSLEYLRGDRRYTHFFAALTLFSAGMLTMVLAENMVQVILGWEIMGLCSFLLIGHWWEEEANSRAAMKAFLTVRVGDIGLLVGTGVIFFGASAYAAQRSSNGFSIQMINEWALSGTGSKSVLFWGAVALFIACIGKSGQFPLHTWLPDAMAGPTPVSSLLHSSTMVVAGVFLVARLYPLFYTGLDINVAGQHFNLIAVIGGITIVVGAVLAFVQNDIKKVLAYSTVSQIGYMMMGLGVGAWTPAVFHLFTHAFFKSCLFLCAGSVSHSGSHHSFDMKADMGGLRKKMPVTATCWMIATFALAGVPFFSGFFSKDEIIDSAENNGYEVFFYIGLLGAFMTAAYMTRATYLTFFGRPRGAAAGGHHEQAVTATEHQVTIPEPLEAGDQGAPAPAMAHAAERGPHESPLLITVPLVILAFLAIVSGYLNAAPWKIEKFNEWVATAGDGLRFPELAIAEFTWAKAMPSILLVLTGFLVSLVVCLALYGDRAPLRGLTRRVAPLRWGYALLWNKFYLDALYEKVIVPGLVGPVAKGAYWINQKVLDRTVDGAGTGARRLGGWVYRNIDQRVVDGAVNASGAAAHGTGTAIQPTQSGKVNQYGALLFGAAAIGALVLVIINT